MNPKPLYIDLQKGRRYAYLPGVKGEDNRSGEGKRGEQEEKEKDWTYLPWSLERKVLSSFFLFTLQESWTEKRYNWPQYPLKYPIICVVLWPFLPHPFSTWFWRDTIDEGKWRTVFFHIFPCSLFVQVNSGRKRLYDSLLLSIEPMSPFRCSMQSPRRLGLLMWKDRRGREERGEVTMEHESLCTFCDPFSPPSLPHIFSPK